jgi:hypothetical protein
LETGCRYVVETPADMDYRHAGPELIESKGEGSGRDRRPSASVYMATASLGARHFPDCTITVAVILGITSLTPTQALPRRSRRHHPRPLHNLAEGRVAGAVEL